MWFMSEQNKIDYTDVHFNVDDEHIVEIRKWRDDFFRNGNVAYKIDVLRCEGMFPTDIVDNTVHFAVYSYWIPVPGTNFRQHVHNDLP